MYRKYGKRLMDILLSAVAIVLLSPVLVICCIVVCVKMGLPVLFAQNRPGKNEKPFCLYKFRTMSNKRDEQGNLLPDAERLPAFGKFLRSTSLDELPELWNILKGDMSIVGPRPLLVEYLPFYNKRQARRHEVRPGLTGLAQVSGRNAISWEEKFEFDVQYIDHITFLGDIKIILQTVKKIVKREGISQDGNATMDIFVGSEKNG